jgi:cell division protease FtsH
LNKGARILIISVVAVVGVILLMSTLSGGSPFNLTGTEVEQLNQTQLKNMAREGDLSGVVEWQGTELTGELSDGRRFEVTVPPYSEAAGSDLLAVLEETPGLEVELLEPSAGTQIMPFIYMALIPILILVFLYFFLIRPAQSGGSQAMNFGKSKAKRAGEVNPKITFNDVAGIDEAKEELHEVVDYLKNTKKYVQLGAKIPKGILLTGPPGVGKTHVARAVAGEAGVPFFHISGSDFVEMFVGVGAARVRDLFETAKAHRPCLIFVDEIDAVGRQRGAGLGGGHDEREQTLNQLLVEMDGFDANTGVIVIAATNRPDILDPALQRPGRFDRHIVVEPPDAAGREAILKIHSQSKPFAEDVDLAVIAKRAPGFTGADLANAINEAALLAARRNQSKIRMVDIEDALDRVMAGPERRSRVIDPKERELIAYHEAGHALVGELLDHADPVHKITVLPRGMSLGSTWSLPDKDKYLVSKDALLDNITMALGGRVVEEMVFQQPYTGASGDLQRVTQVARAMVTEYGMSEKLGTLAIGRKNGSPFLGRDYYEEQRNYSEDVAKLVDEEVHDIVQRCRQRAEDLIAANREKLDNVVQVLLERETINREEFLKILAGEELEPIANAEQEPAPTEKEKSEDKEDSSKPVPGTQPEPGRA